LRRSKAWALVQNTKLFRYIFWALWFVIVPLVLAWASVSLLKPSDLRVTSGGFDRLRWLVNDQQVPAGIVLFTVFEMLLYHWRHHLPLGGRAGVGGRLDLPKELRREYERAAQLLDESTRILRKRQRQVQRYVPAKVRDELTQALDDLRDAMDQERFDANQFDEVLERASLLVSRHLGRWRKGELREYAESILIAVGVALLLRAFVVEAFKIPSGSMLPTLQIQDHIFVNKFAYGPTVPFTSTRLFERLPPKRGDVMVFQYPEKPDDDFIKRVIALEGDTLLVEGGHPIINGWRVPNCRVGNYEFRETEGAPPTSGDLFVEFLGDYSYLTLYEDGNFERRQGPYHVRRGEVWVLGDNRNNSSDSRAWYNERGGGVPYALIKGRALFVWLSFGRDGGVTWDRLLHNVMGSPTLPKGASSRLVTEIERCLASRPAQTLPPDPPRD
jgi:signal peptidase I